MATFAIKYAAMTARLRFAPSPTGPLHIGGVRTALYNYLLAKRLGGTFILRVEDTDRSRYVEGAENYILESLKWLGIETDENPIKQGAFGPYRQSERKELYKEYAELLIKNNWAYYSFDTTEELERKRKKAEAIGERFLYGPLNRSELDNSLSLDATALEKRLASENGYVIRFKTPKDEVLRFTDTIRGEIQIDTNTLDDKVLFKSDGMPTYHLANVVDDHLMEITHVVRGEEWLPSLALHILLYRAFEWKAPEFAHLPLILKPSGKGKLSKRDGEAGGFPVFPLTWNESIGFKESGYEPEALINFLSLLGWSPGDDRELFSLNELEEIFSLERVQKSGARFDLEKLNWFNAQWIQRLSDEELLGRCKLQNINLYGLADQKALAAIDLVKDRLIRLSDISDETYLFHAPKTYDSAAVQKQWKTETPDVLTSFIQGIDSKEADKTAITNHIKLFCEQNEVGVGKLMAPLRIALVGSLKGPSVDALIAFLGKTECANRIERAVAALR